MEVDGPTSVAKEDRVTGRVSMDGSTSFSWRLKGGYDYEGHQQGVTTVMVIHTYPLVN